MGKSSIKNTYGASEVRLEEYLTKHLPTTNGVRQRYCTLSLRERLEKVGIAYFTMVGGLYVV